MDHAASPARLCSDVTQQVMTLHALVSLFEHLRASFIGSMVATASPLPLPLPALTGYDHCTALRMRHMVLSRWRISRDHPPGSPLHDHAEVTPTRLLPRIQAYSSQHACLLFMYMHDYARIYGCCIFSCMYACMYARMYTCLYVCASSRNPCLLLPASAASGLAAAGGRATGFGRLHAEDDSPQSGHYAGLRAIRGVRLASQQQRQRHVCHPQQILLMLYKQVAVF